MRFIQHLIVLFVLFISLLACGENKPAPRAQGGVLDLRNWDFKKDGIVSLNGHWSLFPEKLLITDGARSEQRAGLISVPGTWNSFKWKSRSMGGYGYGSYRLQVLLPENQSGLSLKMHTAATAYSLWVNGSKILSNGIVGKAKWTTDPRFIPALAPVPEAGNQLQITVEVANFAHYKGGLWTPIQLGLNRQVKDYRNIRFNTHIFFSRCILNHGLLSFRPFFIAAR